MDALTRVALRAQAGDGAALGPFVEAGYDSVWRFCAHLVGQQSADDLAQETFVRAVTGISRFRGSSAARTWLLAIARNVCCDELRRRARVRRRDACLAARAEASGPGPSGPDPSGQVALAGLICSLDIDRRSAFVLTAVLGLSYEEAAAVCGCPAGTIRSRVARARSQLAGHLQQAAGPGQGEVGSRLTG